MNNLLCVLILFSVQYGATNGVPTKEMHRIPHHLIEYAAPIEVLSREFPGLLSTMEMFGSLVLDTDFGSNLSVLFERFFGKNTDVSFIYEVVEDVFADKLDRDVIEALSNLLATVMQNPQDFKEFIDNNKAVAGQFTAELIEDINDDRNEVRQRLVKDFLMALMRALSTEAGMDFIQAATKSIVTATLDMEDYMHHHGRPPIDFGFGGPHPMSDPAILDLILSRGGHPGDIEDILHFVEDHPVLGLLLR